MSSRMRESLRVLFTILLSLVVSLQGIPMRAIAEDLAQDTIDVNDTQAVAHDGANQGEAVSGEIRGADGSEVRSSSQSFLPTPVAPGTETIDPSVSSGDVETIETALADEQLTRQPADTVEPHYGAGVLTTGFVDASGARYAITVAYDESAGIPQDAQLVAGPYDGRYESLGWNMNACVEQALALSSMDGVLATKNVDVSIMADGERVQPTGDVTVTIETDAFDSHRTAYVEAVVGDEAAEAAGGLFTAILSADARSTQLQGQSAFSSMARTGQENGVSVTIVSSRLGTISVAQVATRIDIWSGRGLDAWLWVPRTDNSVRLRQIDAPALEDGLVALACYGVESEAGDSGDTTLLLEAVRNDMAMDAADAAAAAEGHGVCCDLADSSGPVSNDALFGTDGTEGAIPFDAKNRCLLLAWDLGLRNASVNMGSITVEGMMPEGTNGVAVDVSDRYEDPTPIILDANEGLSAQSDPSASEFTTVAAFDILS